MRRSSQLLRYATVSGVATLISLLVLGALVATRTLSPGWSNVVATAVGTVPSFALNRRWVWDRSGPASFAGEVLPFLALTAAGLALSTVTVVVVGRWADASSFAPATRTLAVQAANLFGFGVVWLAQFFILDRLLFGRRPTAPEPVLARAT
ncbi:hypothetical protein BH10ACT1_BH10ACT1_30420 [soil metagenome]